MNLERKSWFVRRRSILWRICLLMLAPWTVNLTLAGVSVADDSLGSTAERPNIVFAIADDWGWPHASSYGDPVVKTPTFDRIAREGILFQHAYVSSPSCTPSRNAILTGQFHWRLGWGANLWSKLDTKHKTYPLILEEAGYFVGHYRKSWGPGKLDNWPRHPAGPRFKSVDQFFEARPKDKPFCFWFGASDPHRPYKRGSGKESGMDLAKIQLFPHFPDVETIRSDVADYYFEVQRFDSEVGKLLDKIEAMGELDNTLVVMTGDHGMPFPRGKSNLYDSGVRVPMAVRWPQVIQPNRVVNDFVSTTDLAPTFLEVGLGKSNLPAGRRIPNSMSGKSWLPIFQSPATGRVEAWRDKVFFGKERHVPGQEAPDSGGTPMRGVRTDRFLLIWNITPERWPSGTPNFEKAFIPGCWLADCDNGPTKTYMYDHRDDNDKLRQLYQLSFGKRPDFELYDCKADPGQLKNLADDPAFNEQLADLKQVLFAKLKETGDPRMEGQGEIVFDQTKYFGYGPRHPSFEKKKRERRRNQKKKATSGKNDNETEGKK